MPKKQPSISDADGGSTFSFKLSKKLLVEAKKLAEASDMSLGEYQREVLQFAYEQRIVFTRKAVANIGGVPKSTD